MAFPDMRRYLTLSDSDDSLEHDEDYEDREKLTPSTQPLGLSVCYFPTWTQRDGFKEFFQNWKDAIIESSALKHQAFRWNIMGHDDVYVAEARHPDTNNLLGFIRYKEKEGMLELTNFKARLNRTSLDLGVTSKPRKEHLAAIHGEGLKVAALVMARKRYQVIYEASNFYWEFKMGGKDKSHLYCHLKPRSTERLKEQIMKYDAKTRQSQPRPLQGNIWEDVTVKIGRVSAPHWGKRIPKHEFEDWIKVAIDLNRPSEIIETSRGSLILDEKFSNRIFLEGLLLEGQSQGRKFKYGYNMRSGAMNRDRQKLADSAEESRIIAEIWEDAIAKNKAYCLPKYIDMLWEQEQWDDVNLAKERISGPTTSLMWNHLREKGRELNSFYHDSTRGVRDIELIRESLKKEPVQLPGCIWEPLRRHNHVRTPQEERYHLLHNAPIALETRTIYASTVKRMLSAALSLDERTRGLQLVFKNGSTADLDLLLDGANLMINERWLDFNASHQKVPCWLSSSVVTTRNSVNFFCDHVITELYNLTLMELDKTTNMSGHGPVLNEGLLRLKVAENLRQMPRMVESARTPNSGEILVNWTDPESNYAAILHGLDFKCRVTLHRVSTCSKKKDDLLASDETPENEATYLGVRNWYPAICGCPEQISSQKAAKTTFRGLEHKESYFPMVARTYSQAFFGYPPFAISPTSPESLFPGFLSNRSTARSSCLGYVLPEPENDLNDVEKEISDDLYDASSSDEASKNVTRRPPNKSMPVANANTSPCSRECKSLASKTMLPRTYTEIMEIFRGEIKELQRKVDGAEKELQRKDKQLGETRLTMSNLSGDLEKGFEMLTERDKTIASLLSERNIFRDKLQRLAREPKNIGHLICEDYVRFCLTIENFIQERESVEADRQAVSPKDKELQPQLNLQPRLNQVKLTIQKLQSEKVALGTQSEKFSLEDKEQSILEMDKTNLKAQLCQKGTADHGVTGGAFQQRLSDTVKSLDHERKLAQQLRADIEWQKQSFRTQEQQLLQRNCELDKQRALLEERDQELSAARAENKMLADRLKLVAQSLQDSSSLALERSTPTDSAKRDRLTDEYDTPTMPSRQDQKRARHSTFQSTGMDVARDVI